MKRKTKMAMRNLRRPFEWAGVGLAVCVFAFLPRRAALALADFASWVMYIFDRKGRMHAAANLAIIAPRAGERAAALITRRSYRNMARSVAHAFWTMRDARRRAAACSSTTRRRS